MSRRKIKKKTRVKKPRGQHARNAAASRQQYANKMLQGALKDVEAVEEKLDESDSDSKGDS